VEMNGIDEEVSDQELEAVEQLSRLLLVAQHNIKAAWEAISEESLEEALDALDDRVQEIVNETLERIHTHSLYHEKTAIKRKEEAQFQKISLEMADLLLLETGGINFGIVKLLFNELVPDHLKETVAAKNLELVLAELEENRSISHLLCLMEAP